MIFGQNWLIDSCFTISNWLIVVFVKLFAAIFRYIAGYAIFVRTDLVERTSTVMLRPFLWMTKVLPILVSG